MKISSSTAKALAAFSLGGAVLQLSSDSTSGSVLDIFSSVTTTSQRRLEVFRKGHFENLPFESLRDPTWGDWIKVHDAIIHWIDMTSCPANGDPAFLAHWDNPDDHKLLGSPMSDDCQLFLRERNPDQFGSRLVRHAFHDAVGGFDGWVNHHDKRENGALLESYSMLRDIYFGHRAPAIPQISGEGDVPIDQLISFADFSAWAETAALLDASRRVYGNNNYNACGPGMTPGVDCDVLPPVKIEYGRSTYYPADMDVNGNPDNGPMEIFPAHGGASSGQEIAEYFKEHFGLSAEETVTLMGVHTFGGGRRADSGYTGMWTQSKNKFNNDYQLQMLHPIPIHCDAATAQGFSDCAFLSEAGAERNLDLLQQCSAGNEGRCFGWELMKITNRNNIHGPKFQWRHSCREDGSGCTHLMMHADMGLLRKFNDPSCFPTGNCLCTAEDDANKILDVKGDRCKKGQVRTYPQNRVDGDGNAVTPCDPSDPNQRILASCFNLNDYVDPDVGGDTMAHYLSGDADDFATWVTEFGPLFEMLLKHNLHGSPTLTELVPPTPKLANGEDCSMCFPDPIDQYATGFSFNDSCDDCESGVCKLVYRPAKGLNSKECVREGALTARRLR